MHIQRIHDAMETLTEAMAMQIGKVGLEETDTQELGCVTDMIKDLAEAEYYARMSADMAAKR